MLSHVPLLGIPNKATVVLADILFPTEYDTLQKLFTQVFPLSFELVPSGQVVYFQ